MDEITGKHGADLLLEGAQRLFLARGYANVSMQAIAQEAGMTKGAPYYHFESKEELFYQVSLRIFAQLQNQVAVSLDGEGSLETRLKHSIVMLITTMSGDFSSWISDLKRALGHERRRCLVQSMGSSGDMSDLVLPSFQRAADRGEFSGVTPEVASRIYIKLAMACIDEASYLQVLNLLTPGWLEQTSSEVAYMMVHGIA